MSHTMKVLVIDPVTETVTEQEWEHEQNFQQLYNWIGTDMLDHVTRRLDDGRAVLAFVDDIGLHKPELVPFLLPVLYVHPLKGAAVLTGADRRGNTIDVPWTVDFVRLHIRWARPRQQPKEKGDGHSDARRGDLHGG